MRYIRLIKADRIDKRKGFKDGDVFEYACNDGSIVISTQGHGFNVHQVEVFNKMPNREFLADFIKLNNIKKTLVSKYLGMAENWLTTMVNEKRATRKDISDATLQDIMRKLHIDWTSQEFINVKATKSNTAYKTKPCNYSRAMDKERLQKAMWNGELVA